MTLILELIVLAVTFILFAGFMPSSDKISETQFKDPHIASIYESYIPDIVVPFPMEGVMPFGTSDEE